MRVTSLNHKTICQVTSIRVGGHMAISSMDIHVCRVKKVQVPIFKSRLGNHHMKSYFLH